MRERCEHKFEIDEILILDYAMFARRTDCLFLFASGQPSEVEHLPFLSDERALVLLCQLQCGWPVVVWNA